MDALSGSRETPPIFIDASTQTPPYERPHFLFTSSPSTVSHVASQYLNSIHSPNDFSSWKKAREIYKDRTQQGSSKARKQYIERMIWDNSFSDVPLLVSTPKEHTSDAKNILLYIHGGFFTLGSPDHLSQIFAKTSHDLGLKTYAVDYRLAPVYPFPYGLNDCFLSYQTLLQQHKPENIFILGDSSGANLAISTIIKARDAGLPLPRAVALSSPLVDMRPSGDSYDTLEGRDPKLMSYIASIKPSINAYLTEDELDNPLTSVIHADFKKGFPPTLIQTGNRDLLQSDALRLSKVLKQADIEQELEVGEGHWHGMLEDECPESDGCRDNITMFFQKHKIH